VFARASLDFTTVCALTIVAILKPMHLPGVPLLRYSLWLVVWLLVPVVLMGVLLGWIAYGSLQIDGAQPHTFGDSGAHRC